MRSQVTYKGAVYVLAGGVMKTTVQDRVSAWHWAKSQLDKGKVVAWDVMVGENVFPMYSGPDLLTIINFHVKGGKGRTYKDIRPVVVQEDLSPNGRKDHAQAGVKTAEKTRTCDVCGLEVPLSKWKKHQYHLAGVRTTLCKGMKQAKQEAYARISAKRLQAAKAQARSLGFKTNEEVETYLRGLDFGKSTLGSKQGEENMRNAGYQGEKVPVSPKGPAISPKLTASPFAKKDNHVPVGAVKKSIPAVVAPGKKGK